MTYLPRFLILEGRMNRISPDKYVEVLLESLKDLKDECVEAFYLQWSKMLKEKNGFPPQEISEAMKEAEEKIRNHKKPSNP